MLNFSLFKKKLKNALISRNRVYTVCVYLMERFIVMEASFLDLRKHMSKVLAALDMNETVKLTYRGKEKALIVPTSKKKSTDLTRCDAFGIWGDRTDMDDVDQTVRNLRKARQNAI
jgi:antitoxin (DNA-binding transcriptional repressor) of toxin-antitoxin stability system